LKAFGSTEGVADADVAAIAAVNSVGPALAARIKEALTGPAADDASVAGASVGDDTAVPDDDVTDDADTDGDLDLDDEGDAGGDDDDGA
jgi:hypothetical protein